MLCWMESMDAGVQGCDAEWGRGGERGWGGGGVLIAAAVIETILVIAYMQSWGPSLTYEHVHTHTHTHTGQACKNVYTHIHAYTGTDTHT